MFNLDSKEESEILQSTSSFPSNWNFSQIKFRSSKKKSGNFSCRDAKIRFGGRFFFSIDEREKLLFDEIFSKSDSTNFLVEKVLDQCFSRMKIDDGRCLFLVSGQYRDVNSFQTTFISSAFKRFNDLINGEKENQLTLCYSLSQISTNKSSDSNYLFSSNDSVVSSTNDTCSYLSHLYSEHRLNPLLMTFSLKDRSTNQILSQLNLLSTDDDQRFFDSFMSLALTYSARCHKSSFDISKQKSNNDGNRSIKNILHQFIFSNSENYFLYILANVKNQRQVKYWSKIQRLLRSDSNSVKKMPRNRSEHYVDDLSIENSTNRKNEEIWIDGPLSRRSTSKEIWIDGPIGNSSTKKRKSVQTRSQSTKVRSSRFYGKSPLFSSTVIEGKEEKSKSSSNFDTESIISSHCHLPVLPVFKDHSLSPFRSNIGLKSNDERFKDEMERLEKTLETLLIPSSFSPIEETCPRKRIDHLTCLMSNDEKNKRLSRIVSPTRFDRSNSLSRGSVPNSPLVRTRSRRSRTPLHSTPNSTQRFLTLNKNSRPTIFQRIFGLRTNSVPTSLISPLTVTLDSRDDLMPLTTSSTGSSASGRASSSGYESLSNTAFDLFHNEQISLKAKKTQFNSDERRSNGENPSNRSKFSGRKRRLDELKFELALTKNFLVKDQNEDLSIYPQHSSPFDTMNDEESQLEREIEQFERRIVSAKAQLMFLSCQKK